MAGSFFKDEDVKKAEDMIRAWKEKFPEAALELQDVWKKNVPTAGHKTMAREIVKK